MSNQITRKTQPIQALDIVRGLALLGMLISRAQTYSVLAVFKPNLIAALPLEPVDSYAPTHFFISLLVNGPFESLFSLCFGWSFYRLWQMRQRAGLDADRIIRRQLVALLGLGLLHGLVFWFGDLLHQYALLGFSLLYFTRQSVSTLLRWIAGLTVFVVLTQLIYPLVFGGSWPGLAGYGRQLDALIRELIYTGQTGSFQQAFTLQSTGLLTCHCRALEQGLTPYVNIEIMFLVGLIMGKLRLLNHQAEQRVRRSLLILLVFPLAILLKGVASLWAMEVALLPARWQAYEVQLASLCEFLGTPLLMLVYLLEIDLNINHSPRAVAIWVWISQVGRMSLTNYLLQSGLSLLVFYDYRLSLSAPLSLLATVGVVLVVYGFGLWFSHWWLSRHPQGPLEHLLTRWSYGKAESRTPAPLSLL